MQTFADLQTTWYVAPAPPKKSKKASNLSTVTVTNLHHHSFPTIFSLPLLQKNRTPVASFSAANLRSRMICRVQSMLRINRAGEAAATVKQADSASWRQSRSFYSPLGPRISSTKAHAIFTRRQTTTFNKFIAAWIRESSVQLSVAATEYGSKHEEDGLVAYKTHLDSSGGKKSGGGGGQPAVLPTGTWIDREHRWLSASPDGLVGDQGTLEIKCTHTVSR